MTFKRHQIEEDYELGSTVLGVGVNGKVIECKKIDTGEVFALKVLRDVPKARREVEIHVEACNHPNIVYIYDVYENLYNNVPCLLIVMERMTGGELFARIQVYLLYLLQFIFQYYKLSFIVTFRKEPKMLSQKEKPQILCTPFARPSSIYIP